MNAPASSLASLLALPGSYPAIVAAAASRRLPGFAVRLFDHVGDVYRRVEIAAADDAPDVVALRLAALVHEEPPPSLPGLLADAGMGGLSGCACAVVGAFGEVWKARSDAQLRRYVEAHGRRLAPILLFEVAHEGRAIPPMERAAEVGGLRAELRSWLERLAAAGERT